MPRPSSAPRGEVDAALTVAELERAFSETRRSSNGSPATGVTADTPRTPNRGVMYFQRVISNYSSTGRLSTSSSGAFEEPQDQMPCPTLGGIEADPAVTGFSRSQGSTPRRRGSEHPRCDSGDSSCLLVKPTTPSTPFASKGQRLMRSEQNRISPVLRHRRISVSSAVHHVDTVHSDDDPSDRSDALLDIVEQLPATQVMPTLSRTLTPRAHMHGSDYRPVDFATAYRATVAAYSSLNRHAEFSFQASAP